MVRTRGNQFVQANGDALEHFICMRKTGKIKGDPIHFYEEVPMEDGSFIKMPSKVATKHASIIPCNSHYGLKILTMEGIWIEITKTIRQIATPETAPLLSPGYIHEDLSSGGIYTEAELKAWEQKVLYGDLHAAIIKSISL